MRLPQVACAIVVSLLTLPAVAATPQASCSFTTFDAPSGYTLSQVNGIDDNGMVVGQLQNKSTGAMVAFERTAAGKFTVYTAPNSAMNWFYGRSSGVNAGTYQDKAMPPKMHGMAVDSNNNFVAVNYPKATYTWLNGINAGGTVVGSYMSGTSHKAFRLQSGSNKSIARTGAASTIALALNDSGTIIGYYSDSTGFNHGFTWQNNAFQKIVDYPGAKYGTQLTGINKAGVIVGNYLSGDHAFGIFYKNGAFSKVVYSGAKSASIGGINNSGVIAGQVFFTLANMPGYTAVCK
jgi:hypothetical protein